jgi:CRISPR-associated protein Cas6
MPMIDLSFPVLGTSLPTDHGYELYAALSRVLPALHEGGLPCRIAPVRGIYAGDGLLQLNRRYSRLRFRLALEAIPQVLSLAGKGLEVGGHRLRLGVPQVSALIPAPALAARLVTINVAHLERAPEATEFLDAARRRLDALGIGGKAGIPMVETGPRAGTPHRRILRIRQRKVVGFALRVTGLAAEESIALQENGVGGRGKMGCGFFLPVKEG